MYLIEKCQIFTHVFVADDKSGGTEVIAAAAATGKKYSYTYIQAATKREGKPSIKNTKIPIKIPMVFLIEGVNRKEIILDQLCSTIL